MDSMRTVLPMGNTLSIPEGHLPTGNDGYAGGMDIQQIRRARLAQIVTEYGSQTALADKLDIEQNYISRCLRGKKRIGEDFAERVEVATGKPAGWMSRLEKQGTDWPFEFSRRFWDELPPDKRQSLESAFMHMVTGAHSDIAVRQRKKRA